MKLIDLFTVIPAVTNGWTFAAFALVTTLLLLQRRR